MFEEVVFKFKAIHIKHQTLNFKLQKSLSHGGKSFCIHGISKTGKKRKGCLRALSFIPYGSNV